MRRFELFLNDKVYLVEVTRVSAEEALVIVNGVQYEVGINDLSRMDLPKMMAAAASRPQAAPAQRQAQVETAGGLTTVKAPLPGLIIDVKVNVGDRVKAGEVILVIETMKMENNVVSPRAGKIKEIRVSKNQSVNEGAPLIIIGD